MSEAEPIDTKEENRVGRGVEPSVALEQIKVCEVEGGGVNVLVLINPRTGLPAHLKG